MTQRTINLYDGLEALYYFDSTYYDGTKGEIKDKSGHGNHGDVNGSVTIGLEGPNSFESGDFAGGTVSITDVSVNPPYTVSMLIRDDVTDGGAYPIVSANDGGTDVSIAINNGGYLWYNSGDYNAPIETVDTYALVTFRAIDSTTQNIVLDNFKQVDIYDDTNIDSDFNLIGAGTFSNNYDGEIAFMGFWDRAISDAEISYLNRLTAPRRSQL